jgi:thiosulfate/3-mercaptopyruvate sulfurtransferase
MKRWLTALVVFSGLFTGVAYATLPPLLAAPEFAARLREGPVRIVDIRSRVDPAVYLPGTVTAPYAAWRSSAESTGQLPAPAVLTALLQRLGIDETTPVVVVYEGADATDFGAAARVYWTLKTAGIGEVAILNGGMAAWRRAGLPTVDRPVQPPPSRYEVRLDPRWLASRAQVAEAMDSAAWRLLDARPAAFFRGEQRHAAARAPGTLVGARNVEHTVWFLPDTGELASAEAIGATAGRLGIDTRAPTVSFCNTGHWAATQWFVLSEVLGGRDIRLYPESMVDWSRADLPMANVPSRLQQFRMQLQAAFGAR